MKACRFSIPPDPQISFLKVTIVYDRLRAVENGMAILNRIESNFDGYLQLRPSLWRVKELEDEERFCLALVDGAEADLLLIAARAMAAGESLLKQWIRVCCELKRGSQAAIIALLNGPERSHGSSEPALEYIRGMAESTGLEFFAPRLRNEVESGIPGNMRPRVYFPSNETSMPGRIATSDVGAYDHGGINE